MSYMIKRIVFFTWLFGFVYMAIYLNWFDPVLKHGSVAFNMGLAAAWFGKGVMIKMVFKALAICLAGLAVLGFIGYKLQDKSNIKQD